MGSNNYICLKKEELRTFSKNLQDAFNTFCGEPMKLTGYKDSDNYDTLVQAIKKGTKITLSKSTLRDLITLKHNGKFQENTFVAIDKFISTYTKTPHSFNKKTFSDPIKQKVFWALNQGYKPGVFINSLKGQFIEWEVIKKELETNVIAQCPRIIPVGSKVELGTFYKKDDWVIWIVDKDNQEIGSVWIGGNPLKDWYSDGLIRIGKTINDRSWEVFQILQRHSDGSYRLVKSLV